MNKIYYFIKYLLAFILSVSITVLVLVMILNMTIFNKGYIKKIANNNDYYGSISSSIYEGMEDYMVSSGFPDEILEDIYTEEDIKNDISTYIDGLYKNDVKKINTSEIRDRLSANIYTYLKKYNITNSNKEDIEKFTDEMIKIYDNKVSLYHNLDKYTSLFNKMKTTCKVLEIALIITIIVSIVLLLTRLEFTSWGSITMASSFMLLFIRFMLYNRIDFNNILIVSENFSVVLRILLNGVGKLMIISLCILFVIGIILCILKTNKE